MFTIKAFAHPHPEAGPHPLAAEQVWSADSYRKEEYPDRVDLYLTNEGHESPHAIVILSHQAHDWDEVFIENAAGKTIDRIRLPATDEPAAA